MEIKQVLILHTCILLGSPNEKRIDLKQNREIFWQNIYFVKLNYLITSLGKLVLPWFFWIWMDVSNVYNFYGQRETIQSSYWRQSLLNDYLFKDRSYSDGRYTQSPKLWPLQYPYGYKITGTLQLNSPPQLSHPSLPVWLPCNSLPLPACYPRFQ